MKKKIFLMLPCIAAVAIATFVGKKTFESHAYETNGLLMQNVEALSLSTGEGDDKLWIRTDSDCVYTASGKAGTKTTLKIAGLNAITLTFDANGEAKYTVKDGKTDCQAGGKQQCEARYCPVPFWK